MKVLSGKRQCKINPAFIFKMYLFYCLQRRAMKIPFTVCQNRSHSTLARLTVTAPYSVFSPCPSMLAFFPSPFPKNFPVHTHVLNTFKVCFAFTRVPKRALQPQSNRTFSALSPDFLQSALTHVSMGGGERQTTSPFLKNRMSPLDPLENGAEIEELLKFHCQLFAKVSGIFLRSCFAASKS